MKSTSTTTVLTTTTIELTKTVDDFIEDEYSVGYNNPFEDKNLKKIEEILHQDLINAFKPKYQNVYDDDNENGQKNPFFIYNNNERHKDLIKDKNKLKNTLNERFKSKIQLLINFIKTFSFIFLSVLNPKFIFLLFLKRQKQVQLEQVH